jgi:hypothetical protein
MEDLDKLRRLSGITPHAKVKSSISLRFSSLNAIFDLKQGRSRRSELVVLAE